MGGVAQTLRHGSASVEDFRGDFEPLAAMMRASWGEGPTPPYLYTGEVLADCFRYPGARFALAPAIYDDDQPIAFVAGCPRTVTVGDIERRVLISALLTVAPAHKASGYGIVVWSELMRRARDVGFDGVVNYCEDGGPMNRMIAGGCRLLGLPRLRVASLEYLALSLWAHPPGDAGPEPTPADLVTAARESSRGDLSRVWTGEEADYQMSRLGAVSVGADGAVLTGHVSAIADAVGTGCLVIDEILWGETTATARRDLVRALVARGVARGARVAIVHGAGSAEVEPFAAVGFAPTDYTIHADLTLFSGPELTQPPVGYHLDVI